MNDIKITKLTLANLHQLQLISQQTFIETFAEHNTAGDMQNYLESNLNVEKLKGELTNLNSEFYFASINNDVAAYLKINFAEAQTELKDKMSVEIERIYVLKEFQGKKIGQELFNKVLSIAKEKKLSSVWLGVWEKNTKAISFYKKIGFEEFDKHIFKLGSDEQIDLMMRINLNS